MVEINITLAIQFVNFLIALFVVNTLIVKPIRQVLKQRKDTVDSLLSEAGNFQRDADARLKNYESELDAARAKGLEQKEAVKLQALESEASILSSAQHEAQTYLQKNRKEIEQEVNNVMQVMRSKVDMLAAQVVERVL